MTEDDIKKVQAFVKMAESSNEFVTATSETGIFFALEKRTGALFIVFEGDDMEILSGKAVKSLREVLKA